MVDVAPVGGGAAAGEDAVRSRTSTARRRWGGDDPVGAAQVQRLPVGADDDPGDVAVAGQPAGPGGGDLGAEPGGRRARAGVRVDQVVDRRW